MSITATEATSLRPSSPAAVLCAHCGLLVPDSLRADGGPSFCCNGCRAVHELLEEAGLDEYYAFRDRVGAQGSPVEGAGESFAEFDSPAFEKLYCTSQEDGKMQVELLLEGVHCAACVWLVERLPRIQAAVDSARLDMGRALVEVVYDPKRAPLSQVARSLARMGYRPRAARGQAAEAMRRKELRRLLIRMGVAGASAGNVMLMAFALYSGAGDAAVVYEQGTMAEGTRRFFLLASWLVSLPAMWAGSDFFRGAFFSLRTRTPHMDLPIAVGIALGFAWGSYGAFTATGEVYFDSITALIFFLLVGRYLQRRHQMRASQAAELLHAVTPARALRVRHLEGAPGVSLEDIPTSTTEEVPTDAIASGDLVFIPSGAVVPVDGVIVAGRSSLDRALLSGESRPVAVATGESIEAGAVNLGAGLTVRAESSGAETRVGRLMREVERAMSARAPLVAQADKLAGYFTVVVLLLALVVGATWAWLSGPREGLDRALALLIVACPCALGLATPLALSAAVSQAARLKQLVFGTETVERLARPARIILDKTGTLTHGVLQVLEARGQRSVWARVSAAERHAHHPVGRALREWVEGSQQGEAAGPDEGSGAEVRVEEVVGRGLLVDDAWGRLVVGSQSFVESRLDQRPEAGLLEAGPAGSSPVWVAERGRLVAVAWLGDRLRADAAASLMQLKAAGHELMLLSGDHRDTVRAVADELGQQAGDPGLFSQVLGEVTPECKLAFVEQARSNDRQVIMVGDGVNDAGALAAADVGVAVQGAAEVSQLSANVFLARPGAAELVRLFRGSSRALATVRRGIAFSLGYNLLGITLAATGVLGPLGAAILMPLSSLTVVTNAYRSRMFSSSEQVRS